MKVLLIFVMIVVIKITSLILAFLTPKNCFSDGECAGPQLADNMVSTQATKSPRRRRANRPSMKSRPTSGTKDMDQSTIPNPVVAAANLPLGEKIDGKVSGLPNPRKTLWSAVNLPVRMPSFCYRGCYLSDRCLYSYLVSLPRGGIEPSSANLYRCLPRGLLKIRF